MSAFNLGVGVARCHEAVGWGVGTVLVQIVPARCQTVPRVMAVHTRPQTPRASFATTHPVRSSSLIMPLTQSATVTRVAAS